MFSFFRKSQPPPKPVEQSVGNLMVVLRESIGANKLDEMLRPMGKFKARLNDGSEVESEMAAFGYIGDMHIRFVFDGETGMPVLDPEQFAAFGFSPEEAVRVAIDNIKRVYGGPRVEPWTRRVFKIECDCPDYNSSFFLDRDLWRGLNARHPEGLVVTVAKRGGIAFVPLADQEEVDALRKGVAFLYESSGSLRVSAALYHFKDDCWTVFQGAGAKP